MTRIGRRRWLRGVPLLPLLAPLAACVQPVARAPFRRARPSDASWPSAAKWLVLADAVGGRLIEVRSPVVCCRMSGDASSCAALFAALRNRPGAPSRNVFWGPHYERLLAIKRRYDPDGLFFVHHGVGSEAWSDDGFTRIA